MVNRKGKRILLLSTTLLIFAIYLYISDVLTRSSIQQDNTIQEFYCYVNGREGISGTQIFSQKIEKMNYLFLPSGMNLSALQIHFSCPPGEYATYQEKVIDDAVLVDVKSQGTYIEKEEAYKLLFQINHPDGSSEDYQLWVMQSEHIPSVFLVSEDPKEKGRSWVDSTPDHSNVSEALVYELDETGNLICRQKAEKLRVRGNFTASSPKKAYQFKLRSKEDMLDIGEPRKSWALLANSYDTTLQHNTVSYQLGKELGMADSPDCQPVDLYYDGEYMGNYLLTELPGISNTNVAIEENGSYLMQIDYTHYMEREHYLELSNGMFVTIEEPERCSQEQVEYLRQIWEGLVEAVGHGGIHPVNGKTIEDYLDLDSYARYYLVQQFAKNPDGFASSTFCYIPSGEEKIYFCSLWDFDLCYGSDFQIQELTDPAGYYPDNAGSDISVIPVVSQKIKDVYQEEFQDIVEGILLGDADKQGKYLKSLEGYNEEIYASQKMNYKLWDFNQVDITIHYESYEESVEYFKNYVEKRNQWLSGAIEAWNGCKEVQNVNLTVEYPLIGMLSEAKVELEDKWCGVKILSANIVGQDDYFVPEKEYHCRIAVKCQYGSSLSENMSVIANIGKVESLTELENGMVEIILNIGEPQEYIGEKINGDRTEKEVRSVSP